MVSDQLRNRLRSWIDRASVGMLREINSGDHLIREYENRLAIWRKDGARMTWEELQGVKQAIWGDRVAVEVYPAASDVVNLRHTRHLWSTNEIANLVTESCRHPEFQL